jgi:uncharacterized protein YndB with AHSA1/START domain
MLPAVPVSVCPIAEVAVSADRVWSLLAEPKQFDLWWDAKVTSADPPGPLAPGQRINAVTRAFGRDFHVWMEVVEVDPAHHRLRIDAHLPLGLVDHATLTATPLGPGRARLSFG